MSSYDSANLTFTVNGALTAKTRVITPAGHRSATAATFWRTGSYADNGELVASKIDIRTQGRDRVNNPWRSAADFQQPGQLQGAGRKVTPRQPPATGCPDPRLTAVRQKWKVRRPRRHHGQSSRPAPKPLEAASIAGTRRGQQRRRHSARAGARPAAARPSTELERQHPAFWALLAANRAGAPVKGRRLSARVIAARRITQRLGTRRLGNLLPGGSAASRPPLPSAPAAATAFLATHARPESARLTPGID